MKLLHIVLPLITFFVIAADASQKDDALRIANKWQNSGTTPIMGDDGRILFTYGMSQPHIVCAPLKLCDIALEPGELVNDVKVGDQARWVLSGAVVGTNENRVEHIIIKPKQAGLENTLFIATSKRGYLINLSSHASDNMGKVGFVYNDSAGSFNGNLSGNTGDGNSALSALQEGRDVTGDTLIEQDIITDRDILGTNLNFNYKVSGDSVAWKPVRVYDDGIKTFIDFDIKRIRGRELPALMIYDTNALGALINYRVQRGRYIVDGLFDQAGLVLGVGRKQARVNINRITGNKAVDQPYVNK